VRRVDFGGISLVAADGGVFEASARGKLMGARKSLGNTVVVGDRVRVAWEGERAIIEAVGPRRNAFARRAAGERDEEQVVAANLDQVVIVASLHRPDFRHGFVDRVIVQACYAGIPAVLALNKTDLGDERETAEVLGDYAPAGVAGLALCAKSGRGVEALLQACRGRRSLFVGHSGVGKSTILDVLAPGHELLAAEVNERTGKGRHTTTAALLLQPAPDLELIDTPGVRAFGLWGVDAGTLEEYYPEIQALRGGCRFDDCRHDREPGCAVRVAVERGEVHERRLASFHKLREELEGGRR
jgi:ribosome biogenesis GTPase / thiamine phosphate phosphatase